MIPFDAWAIGRSLTGESCNGYLAEVSEPLRPLVSLLEETTPTDRAAAWEAAIAARADRDEMLEAIAGQDPSGPPPRITRCYATLEDIALIMSSQPWLWPGWIAEGVLNALASDPGVGKTRFALDLARRLWHGLPWPDNQPNKLPAGTRTLWIQGDRNFAEMLQCARDFGLPDNAVVLGSSPEDPTGSLDLDDRGTLAALADRIAASAASLVIIDTVGMTTANLCRPEEARDYFVPLIDMAGRTKVAFLGLTHLSVNKEALGRRIVEKSRSVIMMTQPDAEGQRDRRRLWVDKTAVQKPPPLGVTMKDAGNDYDFEPPKEPEPIVRKRGPASTRLDECKRWLADHLKDGPLAVTEIRCASEAKGFSAGVLYGARDALGVSEFQGVRGKRWQLPVVDVVGDCDISDISDISDNIEKFTDTPCRNSSAT